MTYKILMYIPRLDSLIEMPGNSGLSFYEALYRVRIYERSNPSADYIIEEEEA